MSAVFTGNGLGLWGAQWGAANGDARLGQGADRQYVNLATGNLLLQAQDEQLLFRGLAIGQVRTYNSLGQLGQVGADAWLTGFERRIELLSGTFNQAGSVMRRHTGDGSVQDFVHVAPNQYRATSGEGAHDLLQWDENSRTWSFVEGSSRREEGYADHEDVVLQGRLTHIRSLASDAAEPTTWTVAYDAQQRIAELRAQDGTAVGDALLFAYDEDGRLASIATRESGVVRSQVGYGYDSAGRLTTVLVDLTPADAAGDVEAWDGSVAANNDGYLFRTDYAYVDSTSLRIAQVRQSDGTLVSYTFLVQGRVATMTRGDDNADDSDGVGQTLSFSYDAVNRRTDVSDSGGRTWTYVHDAAGRLVRIESPAREGLRDVTLYSHDADGNVVQIATERGGMRLSQVDYQYDDRGNVLWEWHAADPAAGVAARAIQRTYTQGNQVASETVFVGLDADGAGGAQAPTGGLTTAYIYDSQDRLRFAIDAEGGVRELEYATAGNGVGQISRNRQYLGAGYAGDLTLAALQAWATAERKADSTLQSSSYDLQGRLSRVVGYANVDAAGEGIEDDAAGITEYVYDAQGLLRQQVMLRSSTTEANDGRDIRQATTYAYDGLGRLLSEIVGEQVGEGPVTVLRTSVWSHVDSAMTLRVVIEGGIPGDGQGNDLLRTQVRNAAGQVVAITESALSGSPVRTTQHYYDGTGRVRATEDANGARTFFFYDAEGELSGQVDATGAVVRYVRDASGRIIGSRAYATRANTTGWLVAGRVQPEDIAAVVPVDDAHDRVTSTTYDADGRVSTQTDGEGGVVRYAYDGAGRLTATLETDAAGTAATARTTRYFHDAAGRLIGQLDAEGYLVEYGYDRAGRRIRATAYATATSGALRADGTLDQLRPAANAGDQASRTFHDGRGNAIAVLDAEGYLTEYLFDEARNERAARAYAQQLTGLDGSQTLAALRTLAQAGVARETRRGFDAQGRVAVEVNPEGTVTRFTYDAQGRLLRSESAHGSSEVREGNRRYDVFGNLIGELGGEGSAQLLPGMSEAELDTIYAQYGVRHAYDALGRRIESIDAQGNKTWYLYDGAGRLTHAVRGQHDAQGIANAEAEVSETRYTAFGDVRETIAYTGRITLATPGDRASVMGAVSTLLYQAIVDSRTQLAYDRRGLVTERIGAEGQRTSFAYDAFGDLVGQSVQIDATRTLDTVMSYDRRGLRTAQVADPSGLAQSAAWTFDAFGRVVTTTDGRGNVSEFGYDRLGRQVTQSRTVQGRMEQSGIAYDAFGRVVSRVDAFGNSTTYAYDDVTRSVVVTTPEGVELVTEHNAHGETVRVTDAVGGATAYAYDRDGRLVQTTEAVDDYGYGYVSTREYDNGGRLTLTIDASGRSVAYEYDAVGRVLSRIVDPDGLALTTRYAYDGQGRQVSTTDPGGIVTTMRYDGNGQLLETVQDVGGLNLRTTYAWDARGRQLSVTEGAGTTGARTTAYAYDALGRRISQTLDAGTGRLNLTTSYVYDANDNLVASTDAAGRVTRFVYDDANRRTLSVDGAGGVVQTWYDANGRAVGTRAYAQAIDLAGLAMAVNENAITGRLSPDDARDLQQYTVYDGDGRVRLSVDAAGAVTETFYDAAGRVSGTRAYANAIDLDGALRVGLLLGDIDASQISAALDRDDMRDRTRWIVHDELGRVAFTINGEGGVTETIYDGAGRVVEVIDYAETIWVEGDLANAIRDGGRPALNAVSDSIYSMITDRERAMVYDGAGRLAYTVTKDFASNNSVSDYGYGGGESRSSFSDYGYGGHDDYGYGSVVKQWRYDASGRVVAEVVYGSKTGGYHAPDNIEEMEEDLAYFGLNEADSRTTRFAYDALGRLRFTLDSQGAVREQRYNPRGEQVESVTYGARFQMLAYDETAFAAAVQGEIDLRSNRMEYDGAGRLVTSTNAAGRVETFAYDAVGALVSYQNRDGHVWTYQYDAAGRKVAELSPAVTVASVDENGQVHASLRSIVARTQYDALGNVVARTEDADASEARTTRYVYDNRGHQVGILFPDAGGIDAVTGQIVPSGVAPSIEVIYDTLGNAVAQRDVRGFYSYKAYDAEGRVLVEVDQAGYVTQRRYDGFGQEIVLVRFDQAIDTSQISASFVHGIFDLILEDGSRDRCVLTGYDTRGNKTSVTLLNGNASGNLVSEYNAYGDLVRTAELLELGVEGGPDLWARSYFYYDAAGRLELALDAEGYVTTYGYDGYGQLATKTEYARALPIFEPGWDDDGGWDSDQYYSPDVRPDVPQPGDASTGYDRAYRYAYDALGRTISETIARHFTDADGNSGVRDVVTSTEYDGEDHVTRLIVDGQATDTTYDALGRVVSVKEGERNALVGNHVALIEGNASIGLSNSVLYARTSPYSTLAYDAFGNVVQMRKYADGWLSGSAQAQASSRDMVQLSRFDAQGRLVWVKDALGTVHTKRYDAADNLVEDRSRLDNGNGTWSIVVTQAQYDHVGRQIVSTVTRELHAADGTVHDVVLDTASQVRYNGFGEIVAKDNRLDLSLGTAEFAAQYEYDRGGNLVRSNANGRGWEEYRYDRQGNRIEETTQSWDGSWTNTDSRTLGYDLLGRVTRQDSPGSGTVYTSFDRWGNATRVIDVEGGRTERRYNELNQLIREERPDVAVLHADGTAARERPVYHWFYDAAGNLVGTQDANGNIRRNRHDAAGRLIESEDAYRNITGYAYDALDQQVLTRDALGYVTFREYDLGGRVTAVGDFLTDPSGMTRAQSHRERYVLNQNGDRVRVTDALGNAASYEYDSRGLVLRSRTAAGVAMEYEYDLQGNKVRETNGLADSTLAGGTQPLYAGGLVGQAALIEGQALSLPLPAGAFTVPNGESPAISVLVERYDGANGYVPVGGLAWNAVTRRLEGTPAQQGNYRITFTATSSSGATASARSVVSVVSQANWDASYAGTPYATQGFPVLTPAVGQGFAYSLPNGAFVDPQGQPLTYQATVSVTRYVYDRETRRSLPEIETIVLGAAPTANSWLTFDPTTGTIAGTPPDGTTVIVSISARDTDGNVAFQSLTVKPNSGSSRSRVDDEGELVRLDEQTWDYDYFGRVIDHNDLSGFDYDYVYHEETGQLISQSSDWTQAARQYSTPLATHWTQAQWLEYGLGEGGVELDFPEPVLLNDPSRTMSYHYDGKLKEMKEGNNWYRYEYDDSGNRTVEESYTVDANGQILHLRTEIRYDAHNRMARVTQHDQVANRRLVDVRYDYDAVGNRVRVQTYNGYDPTSPDINVVENRPPEIGQLDVPNAYIGHFWSMQVPADAITDPDGDTVYLEIVQENGSPLPGWLHWDAATRTLSGIPPQGGGGRIYLSLRALNIDNQFDTHWLSIPLIDDYVEAREWDAPLLLPYGAETEISFRDYFDYPSEVELEVAASLPDGSALPAWLRLDDNGLLKVDGQLIPQDLDGIEILLSATSPTGLTASRTVSLDFNHPPQWNGDSAYLLQAGVPWSLPIADLLSDVEGDGIRSVSMAWWPSWLSFNGTALVGTPPSSGSTNYNLEEGRWAVGVRVTDDSGAKTIVTLLLDTRASIIASKHVPQQVISEGGAFDIELPSDLFTHRTGLPLSYEARLVGLEFTPESYRGWGGYDPAYFTRRHELPLPAWLQFDAQNLRFQGIGPQAKGHFVVEITARDASGGVATKLIQITTGSEGPTGPAGRLDGIDISRLFRAPYYSSYGQLSLYSDDEMWMGQAVTHASADMSRKPFLAATVQVPFTAGTPFTYTVPGHYLRGQPGDTLSLIVLGSLPAGVSYDPATRTFAGTLNGDLWINVAVVDQNGLSSTGSLRFTNTQSNPNAYQGGFVDQVATVGQRFEYALPAGLFQAASGGYGATIVPVGIRGTDGWLTQAETESLPGGGYGNGDSNGFFVDPVTGTIRGTPRSAGTYRIGVTNNGVTAYFDMTIAEGTYQAPVVTGVQYQEPIIGQLWTYKLPRVTDPEGGAIAFLDARTSYGGSLPSGLTFDRATGTLSGMVNVSYSFTVIVPVVTSDGEVTEIQFTVYPRQPVQAPQAFNSDFERGDTGWDKGNGFEIVQGGDAFSGTWSAKFFGNATASIVNTQRVPVQVGQTITASCMVQQGASDAGDAGGAVVLHWYDINGTLLSWNVGNVVSSGSNGNWHKSSITMQVPPGAAYMAIGGAANKETNKDLWLDKFEWNFVQLARDTSTISTPQTYWYAYDAENRVTVVNGKLENGQVVLADEDTSFALDYDAAGHAVRRRFLDGGEVKQELTQYDERGQRIAVFQAQAIGSSEQPLVDETYSYDAVGRQTKHRQYDEYGGMKHLDSTVYDADGRTLWQASFGRSLNGTGYGEWAEGEGLALIGKVDYGSYGYDAAGRLRGYSYYAARHEMDTGATAQDPIGFVHRYVFQYEGRESYLEKQVYGSSTNNNFRASSSLSTYDAWGRRTAVREQTPLPSNLGTLDDRIRYFSYDGEGNILRRLEGTLVSGGRFNQTIEQVDQTQRYAYVAGQQVASGKYNGEFDVIGKLTAYNSGEAGSTTITVQAGDTLRGIAQRVYGNANLWYVLAEANSISDDQLAAGTRLRVPEVKVTANDAGTFKPFNPAEAIGNTAPSLPYIVPPPKQHCNAVAMILMVVVAVVVTYFTAGAASAYFGTMFAGGATAAAGSAAAIGGALAGGFVGGVAGSVASQAVGSAMGATSFSWRQVAADGITGAITMGAAEFLGGVDAFTKGASTAKGASSLNTLGRVTQGLVNYGGSMLANVAVGRDTGFSWNAVAASAMGSYLSAKMGGKVSITEGGAPGGDFLNDFGGLMLNGAANATSRRLMGLGKQDWNQVALDAFGNAIGNSVVREVHWSDVNRQARNRGIDDTWARDKRREGMSYQEVTGEMESFDVIAEAAAGHRNRYLMAQVGGAGVAPVDGVYDVLRGVTPAYLAANPQVARAMRNQLLAFESGLVERNDFQFGDRAAVTEALLTTPDALAATLDHGLSSRLLADDSAVLRLATGGGALTPDQANSLRAALHKRMIRVGQIDDEIPGGLGLEEKFSRLRGDDAGALARMRQGAEQLLDMDVRELVQRQALYMDMFTVGDADADYQVAGFIGRSGRPSTIDFDLTSDSADLARIIGVTREEAAAKTNWSAYERVIDAAIRTEGLTSVQFAGAWRPVYDDVRQYYRESERFGATQDLRLAAFRAAIDDANVTVANGINSVTWTSRRVWSAAHNSGMAVDINRINQYSLRDIAQMESAADLGTSFLGNLATAEGGPRQIIAPWKVKNVNPALLTRLGYVADADGLYDNPWYIDRGRTRGEYAVFHQHRNHIHLGY